VRGQPGFGCLPEIFQHVLDVHNDHDADPKGTSGLLDIGDLTQIADIEQAARAFGVRVVIIVDIMHVLEYLWKAAKAWLPPDDPQVAQWVGDKTLQLLQGEVKSIV